MSEKRRDNRNRVLQTGESQRKDGRYAYKYVDNHKKAQFVYAWKLVPTDKTPAGKREDLSLREKEKQIQKDLDDGIDSKSGRMTVCELYKMHTKHNGNVKPGTKKNRQGLMNIISNDRLGGYAIENVKMADVKDWILRMRENGYAFQTIKNHKRSLSAAFITAVQNDMVRKNPFEFDIADVIPNDTERKEALSPEQENAFLSYIKNSPIFGKYYDAVVVLSGTGMRISEFCGLTVDDIDMESRIINVDHQLIYSKQKGYYISDTKTKNGDRQLPMSEDVYNALGNILAKKEFSKLELVYKGKTYTNFILRKYKGTPYYGVEYSSLFNRIRTKYKETNDLALPEFLSPHTMRHTFCTKMANAGMNPKALQYFMGHANIIMTLDYYAHATYECARDEFERITADKTKTEL
ncbi:MAG: integrase DNA-binding domain-containing protein [Eubacterium sp.]